MIISRDTEFLTSWNVIVRCPLGRQPVMREPLGRVLFHLPRFYLRKSARIPETVFCSYCAHLFATCCFIAELMFPLAPGLCSAPQDFQFLLLSPTYANGNVLQVTLYTMPFNCSFVNERAPFPRVYASLVASLGVQRTITSQLVKNSESRKIIIL